MACTDAFRYRDAHVRTIDQEYVYGWPIIYTPLIHSGMVSSVKAMQCCSNGKSPPWFSVELPNPMTDDIEVHLCVPLPTYDDVAIQLLELYVQ